MLYQRAGGPVRVELAVGFAAQFVLLALLDGLGPAGWLAGTAYVVLGQLALLFAVRRRGIYRWGPANRITLLRMVLTGGVTALVADGDRARVLLVIVLAVVAEMLDGADGWVARRTGTVTELGARFDMEVDAFLILVLSVFVAAIVGPWALAIGAMRYAFVVAGWLMPWLRAQLPASLARKTVAAVQGIALVIASAPAVGRPVAVAVVAVALTSLAWSFGRDVGWLWRQRCRGRRSVAAPVDQPH